MDSSANFNVSISINDIGLLFNAKNTSGNQKCTTIGYICSYPANNKRGKYLCKNRKANRPSGNAPHKYLR
jgi:hypothetical protein